MQISQTASVLESTDRYSRKEFGLGDASIILMLLTQQYGRPIQTLVQEYICNARDANRDVDQTRPIEITIPTRSRSIFEVRDFGKGISPEQMVDVFINIGSSTKREDNNQTGGFGIGAKSAWSYTDKFNVIVFQNGKKRTYVAHYSSDPENPSIKKGYLDSIYDCITDEIDEDTDEADGVLIQVPCKHSDAAAFQIAVERAVQFWDVGERPTIRTYESDGVTREVALSYPILLDKMDQFEVYEGDHNRFYLLIDGIPYEAPSEWYGYYYSLTDTSLSTLFKKAKGIPCLRIPTGSLWIPPTRESVSNDEANKQIVTKMAKAILSKFDLEISHKIKQDGTLKDFFNSIGTVSKAYNLESMYYYLDYTVDLRSMFLSHKDIVATTYEYKKVNVRKQEENKQVELKEDRLYLDGDYNLTQISSRVRQYLYDSNKSTRCIVISGPAEVLADLRESFPGKMLSEIRNEKPKQTIKDNITFHRASKSGYKGSLKAYSIALDILDGQLTHIYLPLDKRTSALDDELGELNEFFPSLIFGYISKTHISKIVCLDNFKSLEMFKDNQDYYSLLKSGYKEIPLDKSQYPYTNHFWKNARMLDLKWKEIQAAAEIEKNCKAGTNQSQQKVLCKYFPSLHSSIHPGQDTFDKGCQLLKKLSVASTIACKCLNSLDYYGCSLDLAELSQFLNTLNIQE